MEHEWIQSPPDRQKKMKKKNIREILLDWFHSPRTFTYRRNVSIDKIIPEMKIHCESKENLGRQINSMHRANVVDE